ncbi:MAG: ADP-glyceromanno-heptose 6-epimerase [Oligoflexia bacterium]|nr:ADP-glyceromanno-heptose 6-epimerase [Oligoflexia bacterium]
MIIVTGAAGFIGSQIALHLGLKENNPLILVDRFKYFNERKYTKPLVSTSQHIEASKIFLSQLNDLKDISMIIHMGAITNTAASDVEELKEWNVNYTKSIWNYCTQKQIPMIYASSAATYGSGAEGFSDDHKQLMKLQPLNLYGKSKHEFDLFALSQIQTPPHWYGLKFFNVYGTGENHKARMASSIWHGYNEIQSTGAMTLFKSHNPMFKDGEQARDFIYIKDILNIIDFLMIAKPQNGIYNCGTGVAGTFSELSKALFATLEKPEKINWIETPKEFRSAYQYKTQADISKLRSVGYTPHMTSLSAGVKDYVSKLKG